MAMPSGRATIGYAGADADMEIEWTQLADKVRSDRDAEKKFAAAMGIKPRAAVKLYGGEMQK